MLTLGSKSFILGQHPKCWSSCYALYELVFAKLGVRLDIISDPLTLALIAKQKTVMT